MKEISVHQLSSSA